MDDLEPLQSSLIKVFKYFGDVKFPSRNKHYSNIWRSQDHLLTENSNIFMDTKTLTNIKDNIYIFDTNKILGNILQRTPELLDESRYAGPERKKISSSLEMLWYLYSLVPPGISLGVHLSRLTLQTNDGKGKPQLYALSVVPLEKIEFEGNIFVIKPYNQGVLDAMKARINEYEESSDKLKKKLRNNLYTILKEDFAKFREQIERMPEQILASLNEEKGLTIEKSIEAIMAQVKLENFILLGTIEDEIDQIGVILNKKIHREKTFIKILTSILCIFFSTTFFLFFISFLILGLIIQNRFTLEYIAAPSLAFGFICLIPLAFIFYSLSTNRPRGHNHNNILGVGGGKRVEEPFPPSH
jgi:hypothetical protein